VYGIHPVHIKKKRENESKTNEKERKEENVGAWV